MVGDDVPLEKSSQEEELPAEQAGRITSGSGRVQREEDEVEEQVEEEQPAPHPAGLAEFQSQTAKQTVDLSVHRKQSDGDSGQQGEMVVEESKLPSPSPPHEEDRQTQRASNLSNASKSSLRSLSEGNLKEPSQLPLQTDLKAGSKSSVKDDLRDASKSSLKSNLKDASKSSLRSRASKASRGSRVQGSATKSKEAVSNSSVASAKSGVVQEAASGAGSIHASSEDGRSDTFPVLEPTASDPSVEERATHGGVSGEQESEKVEVSETAGLEGHSGVSGEEGSTDEHLLKQEGEVAVSEGEVPETAEQETLNDTSIQVRVTSHSFSVHPVMYVFWCLSADN